jgi:dienelactone hydrolase
MDIVSHLMTMRAVLSAMLVALATLPASAQKLVGTKTVFPSDHHAITIERFDPAKTGSHAAVMVVHSGSGPEADWRKSGVLEALVAAGYSVFLPHYFDGAGGWRPGDKTQFLDYIRTLNDASRYIVLQPDIQNHGIGLIGVSLGAYLSLGLSEEVRSHPPPFKCPEIKAVVDFNGGIPDFAIDRMTTMPPVLILHGQDDPYMSVRQAAELEALLKRKASPYEIQIYPHQGHIFDGEAQKDANQRTVTFLASHLR